jgi:hypothetical protein
LLLSLAASLPLNGSSRQKTSRDRISKDEAIARAVNDLRETPEGFALKHPRHAVEFTSDGLTVRSRRGGVDWRWSLTSIRAGDRALGDLGLRKHGPTKTSAMQIDYSRGEMIERYLA